MKAVRTLLNPRQNSKHRTAGLNDRTIPDPDAIAQAAYYRAETRGFVPGGELQDWLEAELDLSQSSARPKQPTDA